MKQNRIIFVFAVLINAYLLVCGRLYYLQVWQREQLSEKARKQWLRVGQTEQLKSTLYDRKGRLLAFSGFADSVYVDPQKIKYSKSSIDKMCGILSLSHEQMREKIFNSDSHFMWVKRKISPLESQALRQFNLKNVELRKEKKRFYSEERLASTLLGIVGLDDQPLSGIELEVHKILKENKIKTVFGMDAKGRKIDWDGKAVQNIPSGYVYLSIDKTIQYIAEKELQQTAERYRSKWACAIVQDVKTGDILAMAVNPQFSNDDFRGISEIGRLNNFAISHNFEPGSTFKIIPLSAALEENICGFESSFDTNNGVFKVASLEIHDHEPRQILTFRQVFEYSSNIGAAKIGLKLGKEKIYYYARAFGFGNKTGIQLQGESNGSLKNPRAWSGASLPSICYGQEVSVTCMQLASAYSAIANGGVLIEPQIIKKVLNEKKQVIYESKPRKIRRVVSERTAKLVTDVLRGVVERGTGLQAKVDGYTVAGKTGTAQKFSKELHRYSPENYVSSFCGFLPAQSPEICVIVVVDEPRGDYWGSSVAGPVFSRIARQVVSYMNIPPDDVNFAGIEFKKKNGNI